MPIFMCLNFLHYSTLSRCEIFHLRTKIVLILAFDLNLKCMIYSDKRDFFKLPVAKKVL